MALDMRKLRDLVSMGHKIIGELEKELSSTISNMNQLSADADSLTQRLVQKRMEMEKLEAEHKERRDGFSAGLKKINEEANRRLIDADALMKRSQEAQAAADRERDVAQRVREELERERRDFLLASGSGPVAPAERPAKARR